MITVVIEPVVKYGARGDRDQRPPYPYFDYKIYVLADGKCTKVRTVNGYDNWWTAPHDEKSTRDTAAKFARKLAKSVGGTVVWKKVNKPVYIG